jgi:hypothetical protein
LSAERQAGGGANPRAIRLIERGFARKNTEKHEYYFKLSANSHKPIALLVFFSSFSLYLYPHYI